MKRRQRRGLTLGARIQRCKDRLDMLEEAIHANGPIRRVWQQAVARLKPKRVRR